MVTDDDFDLRMPASSRYEYSNERGERVPQRGGVHRRNSGDRLHPRPPCGSTSPNYITQNTQFNSSCNGSASNSMNCDDYSVHSFSTAGTGMPSSLFYDEGNVPNGGTDLHALDQNGFDADLVAISEYNQRMKNQAQRSSKSPPQNLSSIPPPPMRPAPPPSVNRNRATISAGRGSVKNQENIHYPSSSTTTHLSNPQSGAAKRRKLKVALAVALVVVLVAVVAGVAAGGGGNTASTPVDTDDESALADQPHRLKEVLDFIVREGWTPEKVLQNTTSPQYLAAHWLADLDGRNVQVEGKGEFPSRYALAVLYYATHGQDWRYRINWLTDHDACLWSSTWPGLSGRTIKVGVICPDRTHVVEQLFLPAMDMKGTIPPEIRLLNGLKEIDFYKNNLHGPIPSEIKELHELRSLILHNNDLTGPCPTLFSHNRKLETIDLAMNQLTGSLPTELSKLPALTTLNLEHNKLIGPLEHIRGMPALKHLALGNNALTGPLDGNLLTSWPQITDLDISDNALQGTLPSLLFSIDTLIVLDLHGNDFTGHLPSLVDLEAKIQFLALHENRLSGPIDHRVTALTNLHHLDLSRNEFTGDLPTDLADLYNLKYLFLAFNRKLNPGPIPAEWATRLSQLSDYSLQATERTGQIPSEIGQLSSLVLLDLADNKLIGPIPSEIGNLRHLTFLVIKDNLLSGTIPESFNKLSKLDTAVMDGNNLSGGADHMCTPKLPSLIEFISDCKETSCSCCSLCCVDGIDCNDRTWFAEQDPVVNYQFSRVAYKFNEEDVIYPVPEAEETVEQYDKFGVPDGTRR